MARYSQEQLYSIFEYSAKALGASDEEIFEFTRCVRPDGSVYGTRGKCRKGTEGKPAESHKGDKVSEKNYSWGKLIKVSKGKNYSAILHPEHQDALKKLKDGESTRFRDETNTDWTAKRNGGTVELSARGGSMKLNFPHSTLT